CHVTGVQTCALPIWVDEGLDGPEPGFCPCDERAGARSTLARIIFRERAGRLQTGLGGLKRPLTTAPSHDAVVTNWLLSARPTGGIKHGRRDGWPRGISASSCTASPGAWGSIST